MESFTNWIKDFFGERWTSPMYKSFLISWILWNRRLIYIIFFENSDDIINKKEILKHEYIDSFFVINIDKLFSGEIFKYVFLESNFLRLVVLPIISVWLYYYVFDKLENVVRIRANKNKSIALKIDNALKADQIENQDLLTQKESAELETMKIELEKKKTELEAAKLEEEKTKSLLNTKENEIKSLINQGSDPTIKIWEEEYGEAKKISDFSVAMNTLQSLVGTSDNWELYNSLPSHNTIFGLYDVLREDGHQYWLTDKGKFFLRKYLTDDSIVNKNITSGRKQDNEIPELPF